MKRFHEGFITLQDTVDITDPCYDRNTWCRMNDVKVVPGEYAVFATYTDEGRVASVAIEHKSVLKERAKYRITPVLRDIGDIGVDAGLAGFFPHKRDYDDDEWAEFCDKIGFQKVSFIDDGVCTSSGYGDGGYPVYGRFNAQYGAYDVLRIGFIEDDKDEELDGEDDEYDDEYEYEYECEDEVE